KRVYVIGNKISRDEEAFFVKSETEKLGMNLLANIPLDQAIPAAEMAALSPIDYAPASPAVKAIEGLTHRLKEIIAS
ncbi:MAG: hypothetical protein QXK91_06290, partial [Nitrososphaerales archaeon]